MSFVPPGTGWPGDPATADTPVAQDPADVRRLAASSSTLAELTARQSVCRACPRLVEWREEVAEVRRRAFADETYQTPVPELAALVDAPPTPSMSVGPGDWAVLTVAPPRPPGFESALAVRST